MNILAGFSFVEEVELLISEGASELYCGVISDIDDLSHRPNSSMFNLDNLNQLKQSCNIASNLDVPIYVAINESHYSSSDLLLITNFIKHCILAGISGFILSDLRLIDFVKNTFPRMKVILSVLNPVYNSETAKFVVEKGVDRIIFPRHLLASEIKYIMETINLQNKIESEVFFNKTGKCTNIDAFCRIHTKKAFKSTCMSHNEFINIKNPSNFLDNNKLNCSLFINDWEHLYDSYSAQIDFVKLAFRGYDSSHKVKIIRHLNTAITLLGKGIERKLFVEDMTKRWNQ